MNAAQILNETALAAMRTAFVALDDINNHNGSLGQMEQPKGWHTWVVGLTFITLCSFTAPLAVLLLPCLSKGLYDRIMAFLIALGIGTLSGSCFFIMIPQAFGITQMESGLNYSVKSFLIVGSLYMFFTVDRILQYIMEFRRARIRSRVSATILVQPAEDEEPGPRELPPGIDPEHSKRNELEIAVRNNVVARSFSTRRRVAVVQAIDDIEVEDHRSSAPPSLYASRRMDDETLRRVNSDLHHMAQPPADHNHNDTYKPSNNTLTVPGQVPPKKLPGKKNDVAVSINVVEKNFVLPQDMDIANVAYIIIIGSSANNFLDGMSMGAAFADSLLRGVSIGVSTFCQQLPQEIGTLAILVNSGLGLKRTILINLLPNFLSYMGFIIGVLLDNVNENYDQYVYAVSAGMYLYVFLGTLIPEVRESTEELIKTNLRESFLVTFLQTIGITVGVVFMYFMNKVGDIKIA